MDYSMTEDDLRIFLPDTRILTYSELQRARSLKEVLGPDKEFVLLYTHDPDGASGHWVTCFQSGKTIQFFDPYGIAIDGEFKMVAPQYPKLSALLSKSKLPVHYSQYKLQRWAKGVNTCGKWCVLRLALKELNEDQFADVVTTLKHKTHSKTNDDMIEVLFR
jgi:hypothetical protein